MRTVIIPAAGKATRFGGVLKELLPIPVHGTPLRSAVIRAFDALHASSVLVVTSNEKVALHARELRGMPVDFRIQRNENDLWGAIQTGLYQNHDRAGGLILADTVWSAGYTIPSFRDTDFALGCFRTQEPHRFSVLDGTRIRTKDASLPPGEYDAWGCILWSARCAEYWNNAVYNTYDQAFQEAINVFGVKGFTINDYNDLGTLAAYSTYLQSCGDNTIL